MKTEQIDHPVTEKRRKQSEEDIERIKGYPTSKPTTRIGDDEEETDVTKREGEEGTDHPHDSKTPVVKQTHQEPSHGKNLTEENRTPEANRNQSQSGNMVDEKES